MDPHKGSVSIDAPVPHAVAGRIWAIEGANGVGRPVAQRLLPDGERVLDIPAKLAARVRVFDTGHRRKTNATDAHAIVMAAVRDRDRLHELAVSEHQLVLRPLADRRDELSHTCTQGLNRLHRLMSERTSRPEPAPPHRRLLRR